ncbi:hypothetical protein MY3957_003297 [Beauveria namnaoensis]
MSSGPGGMRGLQKSQNQAAGESSDAALRRKNREKEEELRKLRGSHNALRRVVTALQTCKENEIAAILRRLRETQDATAVATQLEGGDLLLQLHVAPETKFRFSFPYCRDMPRALLTPDNPYLGSVLYESAFISTSNQTSAMMSRIERLQPQYVKPYTAARIADTRLGTVNVARWTNVCADNAILRHLLHIYLLSEYQLFPPFHKDYFINDMVLGSTRFCTSLLVNAVLALACVSTLSCIPQHPHIQKLSPLPSSLYLILRNGFEGNDMILVHFLTVLSFMALGGDVGNSSPGARTATSQEEIRSTLIPAAKGLCERGKNFFVSVTILHILRNQMAAEDVDILSRYCAAASDGSGGKKARALYSRAQYPVNIVKITQAPENQRLEIMIKKYEELSMEQTG